MDEQQAREVHLMDQSIAAVNSKIDRYRDQLAEAIACGGFEDAVARFNRFLVLKAREHPDAVAVLAAVAIARLARDGEAGESTTH